LSTTKVDISQEHRKIGQNYCRIDFCENISTNTHFRQLNYLEQYRLGISGDFAYKLWKKLE